MNLSSRLAKLGNMLVACYQENCARDGVNNQSLDEEPRLFTPRCLYLDPKGATKIDVVVVGMNPGRMKENDKEYKFYQKNMPITYQTLVEYWETALKHHQYYEKIREWLYKMGIIQDGGILWTEVCKCQNQKQIKELPLQVFRDCSAKFLDKELELIESNTPIIGVGNLAYRALAWKYPSKFIIGIPHATGSYGHFDLICGEHFNDARETFYKAKEKKICIRLFPNDFIRSFLSK